MASQHQKIQRSIYTLTLEQPFWASIQTKQVYPKASQTTKIHCYSSNKSVKTTISNLFKIKEYTGECNNGKADNLTKSGAQSSHCILNSSELHSFDLRHNPPQFPEHIWGECWEKGPNRQKIFF